MKAIIYLLVSRDSKRITLMACIAAASSAITAQIVIPRKSIDDDLFMTGLTAEKVVIQSQPKGYVTTVLFEDWFTEVFLPAFANRRAAYGYDGPEVFGLDNCSAYQCALFITLCVEYDIRVVFFPPHSPNQLQPLDLCLFGVTKKLLRRIKNLDAVNVQIKHIAGVVCAFLAATLSFTIVRIFEMSGICLVKDGAQRLCTVRPERAKRLLVPLPQILLELETDADDSNEAESQAYLEECAELLYDLESDEIHYPQ
jgi:hypothetical protein